VAAEALAAAAEGKALPTDTYEGTIHQMVDLQGKYNSAKVFTDTAGESAIAQIQHLLDQEFVSGSKIRVMPDAHAGMGCTIGTTMTIIDKIVPNLVGVDIGCGMETVQLRDRRVELEQLDKAIHHHIPSGFSVRRTRTILTMKSICPPFAALGMLI